MYIYMYHIYIIYVPYINVYIYHIYIYIITIKQLFNVSYLRLFLIVYHCVRV